MSPTIVARLVRLLLVGCWVAAVFIVVVQGGGLLQGAEQAAVLLPFAAAALATIGLGVVLPRIDRVVGRLTHHREVTAYSALAEAAARIRAGSLEQALPGLAQVLADGTGASRAVLWLAVEDRLVSAAAQPPDDPAAGPASVENLAVLLARPDTDHVVPVLDGAVLRAALAIGKPGAAITPADQRLMQDVANGAGLLLRGVALNAALAERVRRADTLAAELQASRQRLARAREVERRRLVMELSHATTDRLAALRAEVAAARAGLDDRPERAEAAQEALVRARTGLDELLDRFRVIARGVYPAVLRDQGPSGALDELATDLPRPVRLTGDLARRLAWEIESGIYYLAASAMQELAGRPAERALLVHLEHTDGRVSLHIQDPPDPTDPAPVTAARLRTALADDVERFAALGGAVELTDAGGPDGPGAGGPTAAVQVRAWLPDRLEPLVEPDAGAEAVAR
ncbi:hypothetical protein ACVGVM_16455 [Pseudonocardia bannensis]|uniref:Signal transduction histidine kinase n=1 Tax=Pseudonocardia bannensis TaxID=630973 RepID=A0A848DQQ2_9PSEU|nr:hypothetical protein [Pseudonocardia bannensis]NMH95058.1 hypothetical protein [Pseudonocardia bannensis]